MKTNTYDESKALYLSICEHAEEERRINTKSIANRFFIKLFSFTHRKEI